MKCCHKILQGILGFVVQHSAGRPPKTWADIGRPASRKGALCVQVHPTVLHCSFIYRTLRAVQNIFVGNYEGSGEEPMVKTEISRALYVLGQCSLIMESDF